MKAPNVHASTQNRRAVSATLTLECEAPAEIDVAIEAVAASLGAAGVSAVAEGAGEGGYQKVRLGYPNGTGWGWLTVKGVTVEASYAFEAHTDEQAAAAYAEAVEVLTRAGEAARVSVEAAGPVLRGVERMIKAAAGNAKAGRERLEAAHAESAARIEQLERIAREHAEHFDALGTVNVPGTIAALDSVNTAINLRLDAIDKELARLDYAGGAASDNGIDDLRSELDALKVRVESVASEIVALRATPRPDYPHPAAASRVEIPRFERCAFYRCSNMFTDAAAVLGEWKGGAMAGVYAYCSPGHFEADRELAAGGDRSWVAQLLEP